ncbi:MAG: hypothetical protein K0B10_12990 [Vicingaceae bacterium]|nr:hypothetical protein [Vicingaceae bacterium]
METNFSKSAQPFRLGMMILIITLTGFISTTFTGCEKEKHCKSGYPLWCSKVKVCCPAGSPYYCDGFCKQSPCTGGTVTVDSCEPE